LFRAEGARGAPQQRLRVREIAELRHGDAAQRQRRRVVAQRDPLQGAERITRRERAPRRRDQRGHPNPATLVTLTSDSRRLNLAHDHEARAFPRERRAVRGKKRGCKCAAEDSPSSSWPGLSRPSTPCRRKKKGVDARHKAGHDDGGLSNSLRRPRLKGANIFPGQPCAFAGRRRHIPTGPIKNNANAGEGAGMEYRSLGRSGLKVSPLCLGAMMFGGPADAAASERIVAMAREAGVNFIDTADQYNDGRSEEVTGRLIAKS